MNDTNHQPEAHPQFTAYANRNSSTSDPTTPPRPRPPPPLPPPPPTQSHLSLLQNNEEEEQIVTSTSNETFSSSPAHFSPAFDTLTTSPARITSSTGNDCNSSPPRVAALNKNGSDIATDASSEDDSQSQLQLQRILGASHESPDQLHQNNNQDTSNSSGLDGAMPTTSAAAIAATKRTAAVSVAATLSDNQIDCSKATTTEGSPATRVATASNASINKIRNGKVPGSGSESASGFRSRSGSASTSNSTLVSASVNMVARETLPGAVADLEDDSGNISQPVNTTGATTASNSTTRHSNNSSGGAVGAGGSSSSNHVELSTSVMPRNNSGSSHHPNVSGDSHKIILKLPKSATIATGHTESHLEPGGGDPMMSSCSNSSNSSSCSSSMSSLVDTRKVEPIKINLHTCTPHHHHHGSSSAVIPKITIKPIVKKQSDVMSGCCASLPAEDELSASSRHDVPPPIPKLTIKSTDVSEPHIVPKLTIRSANEEGGAAHTSIVPKLTIKMSDTQNSASSSSSLHSPTTNPKSSPSITAVCNSNAAGFDHVPPPLPKLTIKTSLDGTSESIISTISPASSSSSSSTSSSSSPSMATSATTSSVMAGGSNMTVKATAAAIATTTTCVGGASSISASLSSAAAASTATVPKLTIKTVQKPEETVPKLTIKTNAAGTCVTSSNSCSHLMEESSAAERDCEDGAGGTAGSKIPKLTIKTGQEHAVIITQHNDAANTQTIPKLTIKTKSLEVDEVLSDLSEDPQPPPEKIPKFTIKTNEMPISGMGGGETPKFCIKTKTLQNDSDASAIPKLTISVANVENAMQTPHSPKQSPLVVRQLASCSSRKSDSPERLPKLMISRQDASSSSCDFSEKLVPKLTIKTNSLDATETKEKSVAKFSIKQNFQQEDEKIPKLTIKSIPANQQQHSSHHHHHHHQQQQQKKQQQQRPSSEESGDESMSVIESSLSPSSNKVVPKLTIKNLSSPKLKMKAVLEEKTASKKSNKPNDSTMKNAIIAQDGVNELKTMEHSSSMGGGGGGGGCGKRLTMVTENEVMVNGESSSSQEFCGFNENTTETIITSASMSGTQTIIATTTESRRFSDNMDIDEDLQQHDPQVFNNFSTSNGGDDPFLLKNDMRTELQKQQKPSRFSHVIDTVDLTSSPSPGSSPVHFNYTDADPKVSLAHEHLVEDGPQQQQQQQQQQRQPSSATLLERLQRETSVIQTTTAISTSTAAQSGQSAPPQSMPLENTNFLLAQLTAPLNANKYAVGPPPPLHPKPPQHGNIYASSQVAKYPELAERLMANGAHVPLSPSVITNATSAPSASASAVPHLNEAPKSENVIDSIEILDTPEGSPRSGCFDEASREFEPHQPNNQPGVNNNASVMFMHRQEEDHIEVLRRNNNNATNEMNPTSEMNTANHLNLKRHAGSIADVVADKKGLQECLDISPNKLRRIESDSHTMATLTILTNDQSTTPTMITISPTMINHCSEMVNDVGSINHLGGSEKLPSPSPSPSPSQPPPPPPSSASASALASPQQQVPSASIYTHRSRKQRHEHLLTIPIEEEDPLQMGEGGTEASLGNSYESSTVVPTETPALLTKKRGRPKKSQKAMVAAVSAAAIVANETVPLSVNLAEGEKTTAAPVSINACSDQHPSWDKASKSRRVQLLRKRLAIDMVDSEQPPPTLMDEITSLETSESVESDTPRRDRSLRNTPRNSRRSVTQNVLMPMVEKVSDSSDLSATPKSRKRSMISTPVAGATFNIDNGLSSSSTLNYFGGSNSSISSACSSSSLSSATITTTAAPAAASGVSQSIGGMNCSNSNSNMGFSMSNQIDLTMSSSSSSVSNGSTTATVTTVEAGAAMPGTTTTRGNSMLPPATILSSSDPVPDVVFKPTDFSSLMINQQTCSMMSTTLFAKRSDGPTFSQDDDSNPMGGSGAEYSGDDSTSSSSFPTTPGRGRGRGRGSRGGRGSAASGRGHRAHRLGRGASAVAKAIAMNRPRCVGALKHTPDPDRLKGLFSPSPQVFEEDTRMSADLNQSQSEFQQTPFRQPDFLTNEESQSSVVSNNSILDPNVLTIQNGSVVKKPKKKKMEVCVAEDTEMTVSSIAEYDWPPPKGCCPSKNRDTFMIQEQVALYLGIKSFKRKYPDLPRRQIDMEERNWLQEKGLVSEKMCDLGITAVWASDILDIMYADFHDKYEEYKDFVRQKHLREIEAKQKALGLNVTGRGLQARDRAMLSTSKWNAYFNKSRKEERASCLDLQTLIVNVPLPEDAPTATLVNRSIAQAVAAAAKAEKIADPPTLLRERMTEPRLDLNESYPLALVPGQFSAKYKHYTPIELRSYPLNTVLDDPRTLADRILQQNKMFATSQQHGSDVEDASNGNDENRENGRNSPTLLNKRLPIRRSRRARTERMQIKCDMKKETKTDNDTGDKDEKVLVLPSRSGKTMQPPNICSSAESSASDTSSSSDSDSDSDCDSDSNSSLSSSCSENEDNPTVCGVCQRTQNRNLKDLPEVFIKCYTCERKVHPSCIEMSHRMVARVRNYNWQCADCKCCIKCKRKQEENKMLFCEQCDRGYHIYCLGVKAIPDGRWSCERCSFCMRCGATKPEGLPQQQLTSPNGEKVKQIKHKKVKWINEYRIDHITKLREHCSMLCVPCGRFKPIKRVHIANNCSVAITASATTITNTTTVTAQASSIDSHVAGRSLNSPPIAQQMHHPQPPHQKHSKVSAGNMQTSHLVHAVSVSEDGVLNAGSTMNSTLSFAAKTTTMTTTNATSSNASSILASSSASSTNTTAANDGSSNVVLPGTLPPPPVVA